MYEQLASIYRRPRPFEFHTAEDLWTDEHTSAQMLKYHLDETVDLSSRNSRFIARSADWIAATCQIGDDTKVADFGCGPGLYTSALARRGANVTGIDFSSRSIEHARAVAAKEGLDIRYETRNYLEFDTDDRFDLVIMIMCDFCALSPRQRQAMLSKFHELLAPGGAVILDVYSLAAFDKREERVVCEENLLNGFWSAQHYYGFLNTFKYDDAKVVLDKYTIVETERTRTVYNWLQYFSLESLKSEFVVSGFVIEELFADVAGAPYAEGSDELALVARSEG